MKDDYEHVETKGECEHETNGKCEKQSGDNTETKGDYERDEMKDECKKQTETKGDYEYECGRVFQYGIGVEVNYETAVKMYTRAVRVNHPLATYALAQMYVYGQGVQKDLVVSNELFLKLKNIRKGLIEPENEVKVEHTKRPKVEYTEPLLLYSLLFE